MTEFVVLCISMLYALSPNGQTAKEYMKALNNALVTNSVNGAVQCTQTTVQYGVLWAAFASR